MSVNPSGLTKTQIEELKKALETKEASLRKEIAEMETELQEEADVSKDSADEVDRSSFEEEMQREQSVLNAKQELLGEVIQALDRIANGNYGVCFETEEPIGYQRLKAQPWVKYSLEAQQEIERRKKRSSHGGSGGAGGDYPSGF